jgi:predicted membrane GTPase involved in stress response
MIVGENARRGPRRERVKEKHLTNMRSSTSDVLVRLDAHRKLTLDEALEFVREDECVEVTFPDRARAHAQGRADHVDDHATAAAVAARMTGFRRFIAPNISAAGP